MGCLQSKSGQTTRIKVLKSSEKESYKNTQTQNKQQLKINKEQGSNNNIREYDKSNEDQDLNQEEIEKEIQMHIKFLQLSETFNKYKIDSKPLQNYNNNGKTNKIKPQKSNGSFQSSNNQQSDLTSQNVDLFERNSARSLSLSQKSKISSQAGGQSSMMNNLQNSNILIVPSFQNNKKNQNKYSQPGQNSLFSGDSNVIEQKLLEIRHQKKRGYGKIKKKLVHIMDIDQNGNLRLSVNSNQQNQEAMNSLPQTLQLKNKLGSQSLSHNNTQHSFASTKKDSSSDYNEDSQLSQSKQQTPQQQNQQDKLISQSAMIQRIQVNSNLDFDNQSNSQMQKQMQKEQISVTNEENQWGSTNITNSQSKPPLYNINQASNFKAKESNSSSNSSSSNQKYDIVRTPPQENIQNDSVKSVNVGGVHSKIYQNSGINSGLNNSQQLNNSNLAQNNIKLSESGGQVGLSLGIQQQNQASKNLYVVMEEFTEEDEVDLKKRGKSHHISSQKEHQNEFTNQILSNRQPHKSNLNSPSSKHSPQNSLSNQSQIDKIQNHQQISKLANQSRHQNSSEPDPKQSQSAQRKQQGFEFQEEQQIYNKIGRMGRKF
eukprot:403331745